MPEGDDDSTNGNIQAVNDLCDQIGVPRPAIDDVFRMGKKGVLPRMMLLKLVSTVDKKNIMSQAKNLRKQKIFLNDDQSAEDRKKCGLLRNHFKTMKATRPGINFSIRNCIMNIWKDNAIIEKYNVVDGNVKSLTSLSSV